MFYYHGGEWKKLLSSIINVNFDNIYLAKIVSFSEFDLFFYDDIDLNIKYEEYALVVVQDIWAYDIKKYCRYKIMDYIDMLNYDNLIPNTKYAYKMYPLKDIYENLKIYFINEEKFNEILSKNAGICFQLHHILTENSKTIDLAKIKKLLNERKF